MAPSRPFRTIAVAGVAAVAVSGACLLAVPASAAVVPAPISYSADGAALSLAPVGSFETGVFDESAAEIVAYHAATQRMFVVNAQLGAVDVLDVSDATAPVKLFTITGSGVANSVAIRADGLGVIALEAPVKTDPGTLLFFDAAGTGAVLGSVTVGALPDMVSISADGTAAVAANEGEPSDDYTVDPEGSVSIVTLPATVTAPAQAAVRTAGFGAYESPANGGTTPLPDGVRIFAGIEGSTSPVAEGLEPEYIAIDGGTAYAALQEANAVAVVDLATATVTDILPLGAKDHGFAGNGIDPSDRDPEDAPTFDIRTYPGLKGLYMPDGLNAYTAGSGETYLVTANEGDAREWGEYVEPARVKDLGEDGLAPLCETSPLAGLTGDADLGRLNISTASGLTAEGCYNELFAFGSRSFSIWATDGTQVFDSGDDLEEITHAANPEFFNSNHSESNLEGRSEDKGPEPENLAIGEVEGRTYAFVGLERVGGIAVYDITDPASSTFVTYVNNRDFSQSVEDGGDLALAGDLGPEGLTFIPAGGSPTGKPMIAVGNEVSGTTTLFDITADTTTVQVLGINDFHGRLEANRAEAGAAVIAGAVDTLTAENPNTLFVSTGDSIGASTFTSFSQDDNPTIDALVAAGLDASAVGNHEFDQGFDDIIDRVLPRYGGTQFGLGANVYSATTGEPVLDEYYVEEVDGVRVGFIGTVTEATPTLVSPAGIEGLRFGNQLQAANRVSAQLRDGIEGNGEADVVVLLAHDGSGSTDCDTIAAEQSPYGELVRGASAGIDAIFSGHTHQAYNCSFPVAGLEGRERPVLQAGQYGTMLDQLQVRVDRATGDVVGVESALLPLTANNAPLYPADPEVAAIVAEAKAVADVEGAVQVGSITADITRAANRATESSLSNLIADIQLEATSNEAFGGEPAQIAFMNPGGVRTDLLFGDDGGVVTYAEIAAVQPFGNTLFTLDLTGAQLKQLLEQQWRSADPADKLHLGISEGFTYTYLPENPLGERVTSLSFEGAVITDEQVFRVTTNSFLAGGGDGFTVFTEGADIADSGQIDLIAAVEFFEEFSPVAPASVGRSVIGAAVEPTPPTENPTPPTENPTPPTENPTPAPTPGAPGGGAGSGTGGGSGSSDDGGSGSGDDGGSGVGDDGGGAGTGYDVGSGYGGGYGYDDGSGYDDSAYYDDGFFTSDGDLAYTGTNVLMIAGLGLLLALIGGLILLARRRRGEEITSG